MAGSPTTPTTRSPPAGRSPRDGGPDAGPHPPGEAEIVAYQAEHTIEPAGESDDFSDAGYETDGASRASTSITSSVRDYAFENGRRYHKFREGQYQFPNDEPEQEREDMKHAMILNLCGGKLHYAPLDDPKEILDIGTGTGIWCIDMGDEYPNSTILGVDLSPIQPLWVPPNVQFMVDDVESRWLHKENHFSFIHARHTSVAIKNMPKLLSEAYRCTKPGGYIELQEMLMKTHCDDSTMPADYGVTQWLNLMKEALAILGPDLHGASKNAQYLVDAGFVNVEERILKIPIGTWPRNKTLKTVGLYGRMMIYDGLEGNSMGPFTRALGWTPEAVQVFLIKIRKALFDTSVHCYLPFYVAIGQKPLQ